MAKHNEAYNSGYQYRLDHPQHDIPLLLSLNLWNEGFQFPIPSSLYRKRWFRGWMVADMESLKKDKN